MKPLWDVPSEKRNDLLAALKSKDYVSEKSSLYVTVYGKIGHNAACVNIEKRSIDFLKMYRFKPTEGNG